MSAIRSSRNEATELKLIALFRHSRITGWRRGTKLAGRPDFVFHKAKIAVFVDGCFWHGCPQHARSPESNQSYWLPKLSKNRERDRQADRRLRRAGWRVARIWQHELRTPSKVVQRIKRLLDRAKAKTCGAQSNRHETALQDGKRRAGKLHFQSASIGSIQSHKS